mgnify:CR=1 FL=1
MSIINHMVSNLHYLGTKVEEVKVKYKKHPQSQPKQCFNNAWRHVIDHPGSTYVLGYYMYMGQIPIEHAWVKEGNGYLDVTLDEKKIKSSDAYMKVIEVPRELLDEYVNAKQHAPDLFALNRFLGDKSKKRRS